MTAAFEALLDEFEAWDIEPEDFDYEPPPPAFCDVYEVHEAHTYWALNRNVYACSGFGAGDLAALEAEEALPPCEHGLSQSLCAGPMHYPADDPF